MIKFSKTPNPDNRFDLSTVSLEIDNECTLPELLEAFGDFLKGCGYQFEGTIDIVKEDV